MSPADLLQTIMGGGQEKPVAEMSGRAVIVGRAPERPDERLVAARW
jgi:hypothetical protein